MKLKMTIIAFFASVMVLTSCMKNEVSQGIEQVRTAYAAFLNAKAQAEITLANAEAALLQAQAAMEMADAAYRQAQAEGVDAETAAALALLDKNVALYAIAIQEAELAQQKLEDAYLSALQDSVNANVMAYFAEWKTAIGAIKTTQNAILGQHEAILGLALDIENGTTLTYDSLVAALAANEAALADLLAEYEAAAANLGNAEAHAARLAELYADSLAKTVAKLDLEAQMAEIAHDADAEAADKADALADLLDADTAVMDAEDALDTAEEDWLSDTVGTHPKPEFWQTALDELATAKANLATGSDDTLASYNAWQTIVGIIEDGCTDIEDEITAVGDSIVLYEDTVAQYVADTLETWEAFEVALGAYEDAKDDTAAWHDDLDDLTAELAILRAVGTSNPDTVALILTMAADSTLLEAQITVAEITTIPNLGADSTLAYAAFTVAKGAWTADVPGIESLITAMGVREAAWIVELGVCEDAVAQAILDLPDAYSDYLYHQTFINDLVAAVEEAEANKEALREAYETWKAEYFAEWLAGLQADYDAAVADYEAAETAYDEACDAYNTARKPYTDLALLYAAACQDLDFILELIAIYEDIVAFGDDYLFDLFDTRITNAETAIATTEANIAAAEQAYIDGKFDYDEMMNIIAELEAKLAVEQQYADYWKALLDEALAAGN